MYKLSLLLLCAVPYFCNTEPYVTNGKRIYLLEDAQNIFEDFIKTHGKIYSDDAEKNMRFEIFKQTLKEINDNNADPTIHAEFGINRFADLTQEEFIQMYTGFVRGSRGIFGVTEPGMVPEVMDLPTQFDWRDKKVVTGVKDQGKCGSGWAFSATGTVEGAYAIKHKKLVEISEQQLIDCNLYAQGCKGGATYTALYHWKKNGAVIEEDYKYEGKVGNCTHFDKNKIVTNVIAIKCYDYVGNETEFQQILLSTGPISISLDASGIKKYKKGILESCPSNGTNHEALLVGFGEEDGIPYWTIKNSWGTLFGEDGYFRVKRGINACGMINEDRYAADVV